MHSIAFFENILKVRSQYVKYYCLLSAFVFFSVFSSNASAEVLYHDTFESSFSNWTNVNGDTNNWTRNSNGTSSSGTGPSRGAKGSSSYMYLETSSNGAYYLGNTAYFESPMLIESNLLLGFQYHMFGSNIGSLSVDILVNGEWIQDIWFIEEQQQNSNAADYEDIEINLSEYNVSKIRFRATAIGGYRGDLAIDNIFIINQNHNFIIEG